MTSYLEILVFKTNIRFKKEVKMVGNWLNTHPSVLKWNIDLEDKDLVLRVEAMKIRAHEIIQNINL
ncbi:hypothetical protein ACFFJX_01365 [Pseudarcicella hirudinis]